MTTRKLLINHLKEFDRLANSPVAHQLAWASQMRALFMAVQDPLLRARYLLKVGSIRDTVRPMAQVTDELLLALQTFRANQLDLEVAACLARLVYWYHRSGLDMAALLAGRMALASDVLPLSERMQLLLPMCVGLAMRWHLPAAWALLDEVTALAGDRVSDPLALARVGVVRASLHFVEGMRARRMADAYCLDMEPGEPDLVASDRHLMACEQHLALVESAGMPGGKAMLAVICALRGDADGMLARLDSPREPRPTGSLGEAARLYNLGAAWRMMGRIDLAQAAHRQAQTVLEGQPSSRNLQLLYFDLHLCAKAAGDHAQALVHLERSVFTGARLSALDLEAAQALVDAVGPLSSAVATWPGLPSQPANLPGSDARLRASEPPCLQRAENLCLAQLPRRLPLASLAEQAGVALRTLQAVARSYRHVTLTEMLRRRVMAEALTRVLHSDRALKDLAEELGYRDPAAFSRDFKRVHGAAPSGYRRPRPQGPGGA